MAFHITGSTSSSSSDSDRSGGCTSRSSPSATSSSSGTRILTPMASRVTPMASRVTPMAVAMTIAVAIVALAAVSPLPYLPGTHAATVLASELTVLQALKREWGAFNGSETWTSSTDCFNGDMKGVACSFFGEIYALGVYNKGIKGSIPTVIGTLRELQFLIDDGLSESLLQMQQTHGMLLQQLDIAHSHRPLIIKSFLTLASFLFLLFAFSA